MSLYFTVTGNTSSQRVSRDLGGECLAGVVCQQELDDLRVVLLGRHVQRREAILNTHTHTHYITHMCKPTYRCQDFNKYWETTFDNSLCGRPNRQHYGSCTFVRPSVRPSAPCELLTQKQNGIEKTKLV